MTIERVPASKLSDPSETAVGYANALVLIIKDQQRRLEIAEREINSLRAQLNGYT